MRRLLADDFNKVCCLLSMTSPSNQPGSLKGRGVYAKTSFASISSTDWKNSPVVRQCDRSTLSFNNSLWGLICNRVLSGANSGSADTRYQI